jgi:hypothetical protein
MVAMVTDPKEVARYLRSIGEPTEVPSQAPARGPPYWPSSPQAGTWDRKRRSQGLPRSAKANLRPKTENPEVSAVSHRALTLLDAGESQLPCLQTISAETITHPKCRSIPLRADTINVALPDLGSRLTKTRYSLCS